MVVSADSLPPPRVRAAWTILQEVVSGASSALDDVVKLYHPDPGANPAVTAATQKRLSGRAATQLRAARVRLDEVAGTLGGLRADGHEPPESFAVATSAARRAAMTRLDDLWGTDAPWTHASVAADAARVAAQNALDTAHVAVASAEEREAEARIRAASAVSQRASLARANRTLQQAVRAADGFANDAAAALAASDARERTLRQAAEQAGRLAADNLDLLQRVHAAEAEASHARAQAADLLEEASGRRSEWLAEQEGRVDAALADAQRSVAQAEAQCGTERARAVAMLADLARLRTAAAADAATAADALSRQTARAAELQAHLIQAKAQGVREAAAAADAMERCEALGAETRLLSRALADATMQLARHTVREEEAKTELDKAESAVLAARSALEEGEEGEEEAGVRRSFSFQSLLLREDEHRVPRPQSQAGTPSLRQVSAAAAAASTQAELVLGLASPALRLELAD